MIEMKNKKFAFDINEVVIPTISPFFGEKGQKQLSVCQIKNRFNEEPPVGHRIQGRPRGQGLLQHHNHRKK
jgi:hypothetical protein